MQIEALQMKKLPMILTFVGDGLERIRCILKLESTSSHIEHSCGDPLEERQCVPSRSMVIQKQFFFHLQRSFHRNIFFAISLSKYFFVIHKLFSKL